MLGMLKTIDPSTIDTDQIETARHAAEVMARADPRKGVRVEAQLAGPKSETQSVILPAYAVRLLIDVLGYIAEGRSVSVMPNDATLTTSQAADMLGVSRPYLVRLLERGEISFTMVGSHRRIATPDLLAYGAKQAAGSQAALDALVEQAQELDMGY